MTRYLVHAIAAATTEPPADLEGLGGRKLVSISDGGLRAYATELSDTEAAALGRDALLAHHELVGRLHDMLDGVLPTRFPTLIDEAGMRAHFAAHAFAYEAALARVQGRVELAVTARWSDDALSAAADAASVENAETDASRPGAGYMRRRQRELRAAQAHRDRASAIADALERVLPAGAEVAQRRLTPSASIAVSVAYLVQRSGIEDVIAALARPRQDVRILINGPWPPYSFATVVREV